MQTGRSHDLPLLAKASAANLKCLNPEFEYQFFDDDDVIAFIDCEFSEYCEVLDGFCFFCLK